MTLSSTGNQPTEGAIYNTSDHSYRLITFLGAGKFSEVWRAEQYVEDKVIKQVAIKFMAQGLSDREKQIFLNEVETLKLLSSKEQEFGLRPTNYSLFPAVEDLYLSSEGVPSFFVESLAKGKPLDLIIREDDFLSEPEALDVAEQLCRVFQVLHEGLLQSYLDFQPKNVFWDSQLKRVIVIDWNLLSQKGSSDILGDLETLGRLFYRLMVGETAVPGQIDIPERFNRLSLGTQQLLARLVNPIWLRRHYQSVKQLREDIQKLSHWWAIPIENLLAEAAKKITLEGGRKTTEEAYFEAVRILGITKLRQADPAVIKNLEDFMEKRRHESDPFLLIEKSYLTHSDQVAREQLVKAIDIVFTTPSLLAIERWQLILGATAVNRENVCSVIRVLMQYSDDVWSNNFSYSDLKPLPSISSEISIPPLIAEINAWKWIMDAATLEKGGRQNYVKASELYGKVKDGIKNTSSLSPTYSELLLRIWGGEEQLDNLIIELQKNGQEYESDQTKFRELKDLLEQYPNSSLLGKINNKEDLSDLALNKAEALFLIAEYETCERLLDHILMEIPDSRINRWSSLNKRISQGKNWDRLLQIAEDGFLNYRTQNVENQDPDQLHFFISIIKEVSEEKGKAGTHQARAWKLLRKMLLSNCTKGSTRELMLTIAEKLTPNDQELTQLKQFLDSMQTIGNQKLSDYQRYDESINQRSRIISLLEDTQAKLALEIAVLQNYNEKKLTPIINKALNSIKSTRNEIALIDSESLIDAHKNNARVAVSLGLIQEYKRASEEISLAIDSAKNNPLATTFLAQLQKDRSIYETNYQYYNNVWMKVQRYIALKDWQPARESLESIQKASIRGNEYFGEVSDHLNLVNFEIRSKQFSNDLARIKYIQDRTEKARLITQLQTELTNLNSVSLSLFSSEISERLKNMKRTLDELVKMQ